MPREYKILLSIALGAIILGVVLFKFVDAPVNHTPLVDRANTYSKGSPAAPVVVTEFADFQCPACRAAHDISNRLLLTYPNDVRFVFRHFPLPNHPLALVSAEAAEAAGAQGKFWEMHDVLYDKQDEWGDLTKAVAREGAIGMFVGYAQQLGLDVTAFKSALDNNTFSPVINQDITTGSNSGVNATPTFFVNGTIVNQPTFEAVKKEVDKALGK